MELGPDPAAVRQARGFVHEQCQVAGVHDVAREAVVLLTSEVVTNAFLHGRSPARIAVTTTGDRVRVEVADDNPRPPHVLVQDRQALDGRGLAIVDTLADAWGSRPQAQGKVVWFEVRYP